MDVRHLRGLVALYQAERMADTPGAVIRPPELSHVDTCVVVLQLSVGGDRTQPSNAGGRTYAVFFCCDPG